MSGLTFNGTDLSTYGWSSPELQGGLGVKGMVWREVDVPSRLHVDSVGIYRDYGTVEVRGFVQGATRSAFLTNWRSLKQVLSPDLGYKWLTRSDLTGKRILARCTGAEVVETELPFTITGNYVMVTFDLQGPWEATTPTTGTLTTSHTLVGDLEAFPTWTCTATTTLATGFAFSVNGRRFSYTQGLVNTDVVVVTTNPPNVTKNAVKDIAHRELGSMYPRLQSGVNSIYKNPASGWTLAVSYYARYE